MNYNSLVCMSSANEWIVWSVLCPCAFTLLNKDPGIRTQVLQIKLIKRLSKTGFVKATLKRWMSEKGIVKARPNSWVGEAGTAKATPNSGLENTRGSNLSNHKPWRSGDGMAREAANGSTQHISSTAGIDSRRPVLQEETPPWEVCREGS